MAAELVLKSYPSIISVAVQWGDMDALRHVNNTVPIRWYESSRIAFMEQTGMSDVMSELKLGPILAAVNCSYKRQLRFPDQVQVGCRVARIGRSSLTLHHVVFSEQLGEIAADGESIIVVFDFESQRPVRVPDVVRENLVRLQPDLV